MRHLVLGTAGHIDHGKSALVRALTGTDPDRLQEEKLRGITIDLGFADLDLGDGRILSFVDVPGHERFVRHMVAGATGIDAVLLAVAADEGIKPQTREHLAICSLLAIRHGIVALTKLDLADDDVLAVAALEVRDFVAGTFLEGAPVIPLSARTGAGLGLLREALRALFDQFPPRPATGVARLPVDRSFVLKGFGTVVTGTLASGSLREGAEVEILPGGRIGRVRGLQVHHRRVAEAHAGQRTAVNLQGLDCAEVPRGSTITTPGALRTTRRAWARIRLLEGAPKDMGRGGVARFHQGTCERGARLSLLETTAGEELDVELRLDEDTVLLPGDRFVLRRPAPVDTVGGGMILDAQPPERKGRRAGSAGPALGALGEALPARLERAGAHGKARDELAAEVGLPLSDLDVIVARLTGEGRVVVSGGRLFEAGVWRGIEDRAFEVLRAFHAGEPLRVGMLLEEVRSRVARDFPLDAWRALVDGLSDRGTVRRLGERVALADHRVVLSAGELEMVRRIEARFRDAWLDPPDAADVVRAEGDDRAARMLDLLQADGRLVRIKDGRLFHGEAIEDLRRKLRDYGKRSRTIDVASFKELAGVTRKNAIPLLEHLDAERATRRIGNAREILIG
ncbi:MAG: selenocysteine-specific translation elongation factor [Acidobacteriia bacterium]|nr:selenocysteine-specific translation elongation factor [Terriglobia bacterium]